MWLKHPDRPGALRGPYSFPELLDVILSEFSSPAGVIVARSPGGPWTGCEKYPGIYQRLASHQREQDHCGAWLGAARRMRERGQIRFAVDAYVGLTQVAPRSIDAWTEYGEFCASIGLLAEAKRASVELRSLGASDEAAEVDRLCDARKPPRLSFDSGEGDGTDAATSGAHELGLRAEMVIGGRYTLDRRLGRGGMGVVWKAQDMLIDDVVAVKFLLEAGGIDSTYFKRELKLARRVTHVSVCRVYDAGVFHSTPFITMEYVEGVSLDQALRTPKPTKWKLDVLRGAAGALSAIHGARIVHRDLKPANVMVTGAGGVKLMDFGLARAPHGSEKATGPLIGTLAHMSPEQLLGRPVDHRTDIYAFGVLCWEVFTGELPYAGGRFASLESRLRGELSETGGDFLPTDLRAMAKRCLSASPNRRPADMEAVIEALRPM